MPFSSEWTEQKFFLCLMGFAMLVLAIGTFRGETSLRTYLSLLESEKVLIYTVNQLSNESMRLEKEIAMTKTSSEYVHKLLRDKYHITEKGEQILMFED
jgi:cell division protein FtsB